MLSSHLTHYTVGANVRVIGAQLLPRWPRNIEHFKYGEDGSVFLRKIQRESRVRIHESLCSQKLESLGYISVADTLSLWLPVWQPPVLKLLNRRFEVCRPCGGDSRISVKFGTAEGNKAEGMQLCNVHPCETYTMCPLWSVGEGINFKMRFSLKNLMRDF